MDVANQDRADADVSVDGGVGDEGKFAALESPGENCAAGDQEREQPDAVALRLEDSGEQRPEENVGGDVQVGREEVRFESEALECGRGGGDDQAVENRVLPVGCVLMRLPVRDGDAEPSGERGQGE